MAQPDLADEFHATDERRARLRTTVRARLAEVESALVAALDEMRTIQDGVRTWSSDSYYQGMWEKKLPAATARVEALVREHGALEAIIDRQDARTWRVAQFMTGGLVGGLITFLAQRIGG